MFIESDIAITQNKTINDDIYQNVMKGGGGGNLTETIFHLIYIKLYKYNGGWIVWCNSIMPAAIALKHLINTHVSVHTTCTTWLY
jgi:hypothetical protein